MSSHILALDDAGSSITGHTSTAPPTAEELYAGRRVAHDATEALHDDVASHGKRMNPARVAEARQNVIAGELLSGEPASETPISPRGLARADPVAAAGGHTRPSPYTLVHTLNARLLPTTPHLTPDELRAMREGELMPTPAPGAGAEAQRWLRQVASEASLRRKVQLHPRFAMPELTKPLQQALDEQAAREERDGLCEEMRAVARIEIYIGGLVRHVVPRVGQHDAQLGMALSSAIEQVFSHVAMLTPMLRTARAEAATATAAAAAAVTDAEAARAEAEASRDTAEVSAREAQRALAEAQQVRMEVAGLRDEAGRLREASAADRRALTEALSSSRMATVDLKRSQKEAALSFEKGLATYNQYEAALVQLQAAEQTAAALRAEIGELQQTIEQMSLAQPERIRVLAQEARVARKEVRLPTPEPFTPEPFAPEPFAPEPFTPEPFTPSRTSAHLPAHAPPTPCQVRDMSAGLEAARTRHAKLSEEHEALQSEVEQRREREGQLESQLAAQAHEVSLQVQGYSQMSPR